MIDLRGRYSVETGWLAENLGAPELAIVDGSLDAPAEQRDARAEFLAEHIPGAAFFDINDIADQASPLPHMLPPEDIFKAKMEEMGIGSDMAVVAYDTKGLYSAARVWWMFNAMGHENVAVLNGGLPKWQADGHPVTDEIAPARTGQSFTPHFNPALVRNIDDVKAIVQNGGTQLIDARAASRFQGAAPEPRAGLRSGHMPGAKNVPFLSLQNTDGTLKTAEEMRAVLSTAGVDIGKPAVTTCGSGVTACVVSLALAIVGHPNVPVYDGSWTEWGDENSGGEVVR